MNILSALRKVIISIQAWVDKKMDDKVDKVEGKTLSTNDFTNEYKKKISDMGAIANKNIVEKTDLSTLVQESLEKADTAIQNLDGYATENYVAIQLNDKVDKVNGKYLSTNDLTDELVDTINNTKDKVSIIQGDYLKANDKTTLLNAIAESKRDVIATILGEAVDAKFDTLQEIAKWIENDTTNSTELINRVGKLETDLDDKYYTQDEIKEILNITNGTGTLDAGAIIERS